MKKAFKVIGIIAFLVIFSAGVFVGCGKKDGDMTSNTGYLKLEAYEPEGATYKISNDNVTLTKSGENYVIGGKIKKAPTAAKEAIGFEEGDDHLVSLKLSADKQVEKESFWLEVKGPEKTNTYNSQALDGDDYTYLILSFDNVTEEKGYEVTVKWNSTDTSTVYKIIKDSTLELEGESGSNQVA